MARIFFISILLFLVVNLNAKERFAFTVNCGVADRLDSPVFVSFEDVGETIDTYNFILYEKNSIGKTKIVFQTDENGFWFIIDGRFKKESSKEFVIEYNTQKNNLQAKNIHIQKNQQHITLFRDNKPVVNYQYGVAYPPLGVDSLFQRSGFIHPLWSPLGDTLTRIQPPDHYHHYGIWGPYAKTHINGKEIDFWNLIKGQGTVKHKKFISQKTGSVFGCFKALQEHIYFETTKGDKVAIKEILNVRLWNTKNVWVLDYFSEFKTSLKNGILLDAYRYGGGIGFRATERWKKDNCSVLTSEDKNRLNADGSFARWCIVEGESGIKDNRSGILFMSHPANQVHPEPMRVWPNDANNGRGDMYFEFVPIRHQEWQLKNGKSYTLKYRMIIFNGNLSFETAEAYWNSFASLPGIGIKKK